MNTKEMNAVTELEELGLIKAAGELKQKAEKKRKMAVAYEHYRFVRPEKIQDFQQKLKEKTIRRDKLGGTHFQTMKFTPVGEYAKVPPADVLAALREAKGRNCFDTYLIAHIEEVKEDPILFGSISGCPDVFFIAQWDKDVSIEDILMPNEG